MRTRSEGCLLQLGAGGPDAERRQIAGNLRSGARVAERLGGDALRARPVSELGRKRSATGPGWIAGVSSSRVVGGKRLEATHRRAHAEDRSSV
jgi:hypothetical protein